MLMVCFKKIALLCRQGNGYRIIFLPDFKFHYRIFNMKKFILSLGCIGCLFIAGCGESEAEAKAWLNNGVECLNQGDLKNAEIYLKKAENSRHKRVRELAKINLSTLDTMKRTQELKNSLWN